jgi:hypothetical protein
MLYKRARIEVVMQMVESIIDKDDLLDLGMLCHDSHELMKTYTIGFNMIVEKAKLAAGLYMFSH